MKKQTYAETMITVNANSITIKSTKGEIKPVTRSVQSLVMHIRQASTELRKGNARACIQLINSDDMRPIRLIEAIIGRALTEAETKAWNSSSPEHAPENIKRALSIAYRFKTTNQVLRTIIRENVVNERIRVTEGARLAQSLDTFLDELEGRAI